MNFQKIQETLKQLGLSERETRVYQALLDLGPSTMSNIVRKTSIPSSKIYNVLERLSEKGLVTYVLVKGKKEFRAANPEKLLSLIKEKETLVKDILPELNDIFKKTSKETNAEIYKGKEGLKQIFEDIIKEKRDFYVLGASGKGEHTLPYYIPHFYEKLKDSNIKTKIFFIDSEETKKQAVNLRKYKNIDMKFLPEQIRNLMVTFIYSDKIVIIPITSTIEISPIAIMIKSKESADSHKDYFDWLWKIVKK